MKFESITIKNFRNFKDIEMNLNNKNVFFGLNDVGKTNFLYALRYVFDKDIRKLNLIDSDYHNNNILVKNENEQDKDVPEKIQQSVTNLNNEISTLLNKTFNAGLIKEKRYLELKQNILQEYNLTHIGI